MSFRLSEKVTLEIGDKIRVSAGPYYPTKDGTKISMGERGVGTFTGVDAQGKGIYVQFEKGGSSRYVYIGSEYVSDITGTVLRPHKITKVRKKKNESHAQEKVSKVQKKKKIHRSK